MGEDVVIAHEVGHALGFPHMGASCAMIPKIIEMVSLHRKTELQPV
jgi:predicted Zn-dependent protease